MWELADTQGSYKMLISEPKVAVRYINLQKLWLSSYLIDGPTPMHIEQYLLFFGVTKNKDTETHVVERVKEHEGC